MYEWESLFIDDVRNRGKNLFLNHKVVDLKETEKGFSAAVLMRTRMEVSARKTDAGVWRMSCRCPVSRAGRNCEHMAALMYAAEAAKEGKENGQQEKERAVRREIIRQVKAEEARRHAEKLQKELEEQEKCRKEEEKRLAEEKRQKEEKKRLAEERKRIAREKKEKEEEKRLKEEQQRMEEEKRVAEEEKYREEVQRQADYTLLGSSWEEELESEDDGNAQMATQKLLEYRYFDGTAIRSSVKIPTTVTAEGEKLSNLGKVVLENVASGFDRQNWERIGQMDAVGYEQKRQFPIQILFNRKEVVQFYCQCRNCAHDYYAIYDPSNTKCPYKAGALKLLEDYLKKHNVGDATDMQGHRLLTSFEAKRAAGVMADAQAKEESLRLVPRLTKKDGKLSVSFKVGESKLFVIKKLDVFCHNVKNSLTDVYGTSTEFNHDPANFTEEGRRWIHFIRKIVREEIEFQQRMYSSRFFYGREKNSVGSSLELFGWRLDELYESLGEGSIDFEDKDQKSKGSLSCLKQNPKVSIKISEDLIPGNKEFHGIKVEGQFPELYYGTNAAYYITDKYFCRAEKEFLDKAEPLANIADNDRFSLKVGRNRITEFYTRVLPQLQSIAAITETQPEKFRSYVLPDAHFAFYLDAVDGDVVCKAYAVYDGREYSVLECGRKSDEGTLEPFRDVNREEEIIYYLAMWFSEISWDEDELRCGKNEEAIYQLMKQGTERLMELGEVRCTKRFLQHHSVSRVHVSVGVSLSSGLLDLDVSIEDVPAEELLEILKSYRRKQKYYRLKNGSFVDLEEPSLEMLAELTEAMNLKDKELLKGKMKLPVYRTLYLDKMLEEHDTVISNRDSRFKEVVKGFKTVKDADFEEPASLSKQMRKYQKDGYKWLRTMEAWQFGGILADDMGLGKTLQVIAVMLAAKEEGRGGTSLVVTPASLVFNWGAEFEKFAPGLTVSLITGNLDERQKKLDEYQKADVLVTSYDLLKRDIAMYEDKEFSYEIIDEAQYIKNHTTAAAKAVKVIHSKIRYALTGTPIENRLSELWSIFDYLMPGFLYGYDVFKKEIETPIVKNNDEKALKRLQKMTGPFILRRLKEDVLKDLPEKLEEYRYVRLGSTQQKLYDGQVIHMKEQIARQNSEDFNKNKLQILAELTRLRQICCDPSLCFENYNGEAAKLEACLDLVQSAIDGGHRILLFSQFTSMLEILQRELTEREIPYYVITGSTSKEKRLELVRKFNEGTVPVFLISLKAGGVGLNLTGADVVIHYDPWWNLAAQNQATDRAHRIGQKKKVTVYKLIVSHTIEEKIQKLQESKKNLADQVINGEGGSLGSMSREELLELLEV